VDVRVIAATNRDLTLAINEGRFRKDLFYRLNVFPILVPPLRERREDIQPLVWVMVKEFENVFGKTIERIQKKSMDSLERYYWPGNVRELRNLVERAMILNIGPTLVIDLPDMVTTAVQQSISLKEIERMHILSVLERTGWRVRGENGAAEVLGLNPSTLEFRMKKLNIKRRTK
jgi:transcriptional regulator with GAF, ATPase, and Fis domain